MSIERLTEALLRGEPYFGTALRAMQGVPERHQYFKPVVSALAARGGGELAVLEIGSWAGASTVTWALALRECGVDGTVTCVDPWAPYFDLRAEKDSVYWEMDRAAREGLIFRLFDHNIHAAGVSEMVRVCRGTSQEILPGLPDESFDIIYVDGSHQYADICFDIAAAKRLLRGDGVICGDDLELEAGSVPASELDAAIAAHRDYLSCDGARTDYHPGVTKAVSEAFPEVKVLNGFWAAKRSGQAWVVPTFDLSSLEMPSYLKPVGQDCGLIESTSTHNILQVNGSFVAVAKTLGAVDLFHEYLGDRELGQLLVKGDSLDEVRQRLAARGRTDVSQPLFAPSQRSKAQPKSPTRRSYDDLLAEFRPEAPFPDFVTICPGKTGTTWVACHLGEHPDIYVPPEKETRYFDTRWRFERLERYQARFVEAGSRWKGESTPSYALLPASAIRAIHRMNPGLKLIFLARRLPERAWSHTRHCWRYRGSTFRNTAVPFSELTAAELIQDFLSDYELTAADYAGTLRRWLEVFPPEHFHVRYFEDAVANPVEYFEDLQQFLGVLPVISGELRVPVNVGMEASLPGWAGEFLENLFAPRQAEVEAFLRTTFGLQAPWSVARTTAAEPLWLEDRSGGWRVELHEGFFHGRNLSTGETLTNAFLFDLRAQIDRGAEGQAPDTRSTEERRLAHVLHELDIDFDRSQLEPLGATRYFSVLRLNEQFLALPKSAEALDITTVMDKLNASSDDLLVAGSRDELQKRIDSAEVQLAIEDLTRRVDWLQYGPEGDAQAVHLSESYRGFNLVHYGGLVYGMSRALGQVDVTEGREVLEQRHGPLRLIVDDSAAVVRLRIDAALLQHGVSILEQDRLEVPYLVSSYRGFNLVHYGGLVYGVALSLGPVDVTEGRKALEQRYGPDQLIVDDSTAAVRLRIDAVFTNRELAALRQQLQMLQYGPAMDPGAVHLAGSYRGFNLVYHGSLVFGIAMSLGPVDVTEGREALEQRYPPDRLIVCESAGLVRLRIDLLLAANETASTVESLHGTLEKAGEEIRVLRAEQQRIESLLESHARELRELKRTWFERLRALRSR